MKTIFIIMMLVSSLMTITVAAPAQASCTRTNAIIRIPLTSARHSTVIAHANYAIRVKHYPRIMILNRAGAASRRTALLKGVVTRPGYDRDEYPAAVGRRVIKADVRLIPSGQNRSAGAVMGNTLRPYCDGTRFYYAGT